MFMLVQNWRIQHTAQLLLIVNFVVVAAEIAVVAVTEVAVGVIAAFVAAGVAATVSEYYYELASCLKPAFGLSHG